MSGGTNTDRDNLNVDLLIKTGSTMITVTIKLNKFPTISERTPFFKTVSRYSVKLAESSRLDIDVKTEYFAFSSMRSRQRNRAEIGCKNSMNAYILKR
jgi:hypothetical protein